MSTSTINMEEKKPIIEQYLFERRILLSCTGLVALGIVIWITAISTDHWYMIEGGNGIYVNATNRYFVSSHSGLWKSCRTMRVTNEQYENLMQGTTRPAESGNKTVKIKPKVPHSNETQPIMLNSTYAATFKKYRKCRYFDIFATEQKLKSDQTTDSTMMDYTRTEVSFAIITLIVMCMGCGFSVYTFLNPRYMFKRLAGGIHFISAATSLVVIQVLVSAVDYEKQYLNIKHPKGSIDKYGYGIYLAWVVLAINLIAGFFFMLYSRKRKGSKAINEEFGMADEPTIMGR